MKYLKLLPVVAIVAFTMFLTSCQTWTSPPGLSAADVLLRRDVRAMFPAITISENDRLTYGTLCQIVEQNVTAYCTFPETAPAEFPQSLCRPGAKACLEVLGAPQTPVAPIALPPRNAV